MAFKFFMKRKLKENTKSKEDIASDKDLKDGKKILGNQKGKPVYAFIDASNLFWGGTESIGFKIDYGKLRDFLKKKFNVEKIFYYSGIRIFDFEYTVLNGKPLDLGKLQTHLRELLKNSSEKDALLIEKTLNKINFYQRLEDFGYEMRIKPAKVSYDEDDEKQERPILKANCDVDMTFDMMRYMQQYSGFVAMTGDGDFAPVLNYLKYHDRSIVVFSRWERTAKEIKQIAGENFFDFSKLKDIVKYNSD